MTVEKSDLLNNEVKHIDIASFDSTPIIKAMKKMSFTARDTANAAQMLTDMIDDKDCKVILTIAGSTSAAGCMKIYRDMVQYKMVDAVVATGAAIIDMDFFEALGYKHYQGTPNVDDTLLRNLYIDRIYDTFIDEEQLQDCDATLKIIADSLEPRPYSSREFIFEIGKYLARIEAAREDGVAERSLISAAYERDVPIFCPAFTDSSAGFGLVQHQTERIAENKPYVTIDSVADFRELTHFKINSTETGLFMIGGGSPKNFAQDTVVCAEVLGFENIPMHKYAVQITVADVRDGACSSSTLKEANSWGKVDSSREQMVYAEATSILPLIVSYAFHNRKTGGGLGLVR